MSVTGRECERLNSWSLPSYIIDLTRWLAWALKIHDLLHTKFTRFTVLASIRLPVTHWSLVPSQPVFTLPTSSLIPVFKLEEPQFLFKRILTLLGISFLHATKTNDRTNPKKEIFAINIVWKINTCGLIIMLLWFLLLTLHYNLSYSLLSSLSILCLQKYLYLQHFLQCEIYIPLWEFRNHETLEMQFTL